MEELSSFIKEMFQLGRSRQLVRKTCPRPPVPLFTIQHLEDALNDHAFKRSDVLFLKKNAIDNFLVSSYHDGSDFPKPELREAIRSSGKAMRVNNVWKFDDRLRELYELLNRDMDGEITINAYYAEAGSESFSFHYDMCDGVVLGLEGEKAWSFITESGEEDVVSRFDVLPYDSLLIPRGLIHKAKCTTASCLHLSFVLDQQGFFNKFWHRESKIEKSQDPTRIELLKRT